MRRNFGIPRRQKQFAALKMAYQPPPSIPMRINAAIYRARKWMLRHPNETLACAALILAVCVILASVGAP